MFPLTKCLDPEPDYQALAPEMELVMAIGTAGQQDDHRRWEYSMALRAITLHRAAYAVPLLLGTYRILDVGGAGSSFANICLGLGGDVQCQVVDPRLNAAVEDLQVPLEVDAVVSVSTLEHVQDEAGFLAALHRHLHPGGLLFLTMDCWDGEGLDTAHFSWMRYRIYSMRTWRNLAEDCEALGFRPFGTADWTYHGHWIRDYSFASLTMTKGA